MHPVVYITALKGSGSDSYTPLIRFSKVDFPMPRVPSTITEFDERAYVCLSSSTGLASSLDEAKGPETGTTFCVGIV